MVDESKNQVRFEVLTLFKALNIYIEPDFLLPILFILFYFLRIPEHVFGYLLHSSLQNDSTRRVIWVLYQNTKSLFGNYAQATLVQDTFRVSE
jgi:hypothetical protein